MHINTIGLTVAVYNGGNFLRKCLQSLVNQTYKDIYNCC
jgi:glycosyltransferase involved in cell wall biosynthesis